MSKKPDSEINLNPVVKIAFLGYLVIIISCVKMKK
jgi:Ni,Fe-hydrogenase I cytochrome b subunit